jgi:hypothetical protein
VAFAVNGQKLRVAVDLKQNGGNVDMTVATVVPGATSASVFTASAAFAGTVGAVTRVAFGQFGIASSVMGHFSVQGVADTLFDLAGPVSAFNGEPAAARVARICGEEGIACRILGPPSLSTPMGNQPVDTLFNILQQCENTDLGMLYEPRQALGIGYRTRTSLYNQAALATATFTGAQIYQGFASTSDPQLTVNDVTATAPDGTTARSQITAGIMSVQSPPNGIGRIDTAISPAPQLDAAVAQIASWYLSVRSVDDDRYPAIPFQMARASTPQTVALLDAGDYLQVTGIPSWLPPGPVKQLCAGFAETYLPGPVWEIDVNGIPELPYEVGIIGDAVLGHIDTSGSQLTSAITSGATSFQVTTTAGQVWTTSGSFPFDIVIDREQMTVTNITSATSPQTFTVTRSVNGVVLAHNAAAPVRLFHPMTLGL